LDLSDHIKYSFKTTTPKATILADKILFRQLLLNLFQNSIQAMELAPDAYIQVSLRQEHNGIVIEFSDNGPGIPKEIQNRIFEPLYTSKNEGFGLGLTLCAQIVTRHKGSIEIKESSKEGTTFIIRLPNLKHI
jgi:signal transduction histidine kinase